MRAQTLATACIALATGISASAETTQEHSQLPSSHKVVFFGDSENRTSPESADSLINIFYEDQFRHAQDPRAPYFLFMSRDAKIAMGVGGKVQGNLSYDFDGSIDGSDFLPYKIPVPRDPANPTSFQAGMQQTSLVFTIFGRSKFGNYIVNVQGKFGGPSNTFKLSKAYITVGHLTLGKTKSTFVDPTAIPSTVETAGPSGASDATAILLRYSYAFSKKYSAALSIEAPDNDYLTLDGANASTSDCAPNLAAFVQYGSNDSHLRLSGKLKTMRYRDLINQTNRHATGYGLSLTGVGKVLPPLTFYGGVNYGKGIGGALINLSTGANDLLPYSSASDGDYGRMYAPESLGWYAALQYNFTPSIYSTVVFSQDRLYTKGNTAYVGDNYRRGMYAVANVFWDVTSRLQLGAEFDWGRRVDMNGNAANAHRFSLMGAFSF